LWVFRVVNWSGNLDALILVDVGGRLTLGKLTKADGSVAATGDITNAKVKLFGRGQQNDTTSPLQDWTAATVGAGGTIYYDIGPALAGDLGKDYRALWRFTLDSREQYRDQIFHVVQTRFEPTYTAADLDAEESWLSTFTHITEARKSAIITKAYDDIWTMIKGTGRHPWLIFNQGDINRCVHYKAMAKICLGEIREAGDHWHIKTSEYHGQLTALWEQMALSYSETDDATPDGETCVFEIQTARVS